MENSESSMLSAKPLWYRECVQHFFPELRGLQAWFPDPHLYRAVCCVFERTLQHALNACQNFDHSVPYRASILNNNPGLHQPRYSLQSNSTPASQPDEARSTAQNTSYNILSNQYTQNVSEKGLIPRSLNGMCFEPLPGLITENNVKLQAMGDLNRNSLVSNSFDLHTQLKNSDNFQAPYIHTDYPISHERNAFDDQSGENKLGNSRMPDVVISDGSNEETMSCVGVGYSPSEVLDQHCSSEVLGIWNKHRAENYDSRNESQESSEYTSTLVPRSSEYQGHLYSSPEILTPDDPVLHNVTSEEPTQKRLKASGDIGSASPEIDVEVTEDVTNLSSESENHETSEPERITAGTEEENVLVASENDGGTIEVEGFNGSGRCKPKENSGSSLEIIEDDDELDRDATLDGSNGLEDGRHLDCLMSPEAGQVMFVGPDVKPREQDEALLEGGNLPHSMYEPSKENPEVQNQFFNFMQQAASSNNGRDSLLTRHDQALDLRETTTHVANEMHLDYHSYASGSGSYPPQARKNTMPRGKRCGTCPGCTYEGRCGECKPCLSTSKSHQTCKFRICLTLLEKRKMSQKSERTKKGKPRNNRTPTDASFYSDPQQPMAGLPPQDCVPETLPVWT